MARIPRLPSEDGPSAEGSAHDAPASDRPEQGRSEQGRSEPDRIEPDGAPVARLSRMPERQSRSPRPGTDSPTAETRAAESRTGEPAVSARKPRPDAASAGAATPSGADSGRSGAHADVVPLDRRRRPRWGRRVLLTAVVAVVLSLVAVLLANVTPWMRVDEVQVSGNKFVSSTAIRSAVKEAEGRPLPQVDVQGLERRLEAIPGIDKAQISGRPPHGLMVTVNERSPVAQVQRKGGTDLIDSSGRTITTVQDASKYKLPIISESTSKNPGVFRALTTALSNVPDSILEDMREARASSRDSVELLMNSGLRIVWGDESRPAQKAAVLEAVLKGVKGAKPDPTTGAVPAQPTLVDVSVPERPVTR